MTPGSAKEKCAALALGVTALCLLAPLLTATLRAVPPRPAAPRPQDKGQILCLGPASSGGPASTAQILETLLNIYRPQAAASVSQVGAPGANTTQLSVALRGHVFRFGPPRVVFIQAGDENFWNFSGYLGLVSDRRPRALFSLLEKSRAAAFARFLRHRFSSAGEKPAAAQASAAKPPAEKTAGPGRRLLDEARNNAEKGKPARAIALAVEALKQPAPAVVDEAFRLIAEVLREARNPEAAQKVLNAGLAHGAPAAGLCAEELALTEADRGNFAGARDRTERVLRLSPSPGKELYARLGHLYSLEGKNEEALESFRAGIEKHPESALCLKGAGLALMKLGHFDEAAQNLLSALRLRPADMGTAYAIKGCLPRMKNPEALKRELEKFPSLYNGFSSAAPAPREKIALWIRGDLLEAAAFCRKNNIRPVLLTYPQGSPANAVIRAAAAEEELELVDLEAVPGAESPVTAARALFSFLEKSDR